MAACTIFFDRCVSVADPRTASSRSKSTRSRPFGLPSDRTVHPSAWTFPEVFAPHARLRNWLMFEVALELGIRRGELLKLRLDSLPRGANDGVLILRRP